MCAKGAGGGDASCVLRVLVGDASCVLRVLVEGMPHVC